MLAGAPMDLSAAAAPASLTPSVSGEPAPSPRRGDFRRLHRLRMRWSEVDLQGIVFNGHYLNDLDVAVGEHWRALALPYVEAMRRLDGDLYLRKATLDYRGAALLDDALDIGIRCGHLGRSSLRLDAAVFRQERLLLTAELIYVFADPAARASRPLPAALRELLQAYDAGQTMVEVRTGSWAELGADAAALRAEVFVQEQRIPAELEWDEADASCLHAVARNRLGMPLATGRLTALAPGIGKIGRMAVRQPVRGAGCGAAVLHALMRAARARGDTELRLHAQSSAVDFYARAGFATHGPRFDEAGIDHVEMRLAL